MIGKKFKRRKICCSLSAVCIRSFDGWEAMTRIAVRFSQWGVATSFEIQCFFGFICMAVGYIRKVIRRWEWMMAGWLW